MSLVNKWYNNFPCQVVRQEKGVKESQNDPNFTVVHKISRERAREMLKGAEDLINLNEMDDSHFSFNSIMIGKSVKKDDEANAKAKGKGKEVGETAHYSILSEQLSDGSSGIALPASPPFTKVSAIKMYKKPSTPSKSKSKSNLSTVVSVSSSGSASQSFLPRIKKRIRKPLQ